MVSIVKNEKLHCNVYLTYKQSNPYFRSPWDSHPLSLPQFSLLSSFDAGNRIGSYTNWQSTQLKKTPINSRATHHTRAGNWLSSKRGYWYNDWSNIHKWKGKRIFFLRQMVYWYIFSDNILWAREIFLRVWPSRQYTPPEWQWETNELFGITMAA